MSPVALESLREINACYEQLRVNISLSTLVVGFIVSFFMYKEPEAQQSQIVSLRPHRQ